MFSHAPIQNDDIIARLQAYGQSLNEDGKTSCSAGTQDPSGCHLTSKSDEASRAENGGAELAATDVSADTTPNATIKVPELTLNPSSKDGTDSKRPSQQWEVEGEVDKAEFGGLKTAGSTESIASKSTASYTLTIGSVSGNSTKSSASKGETSIFETLLHVNTPDRKHHIFQYHVHRQINQERRLQRVHQILQSSPGLSACSPSALCPRSNHCTQC